MHYTDYQVHHGDVWHQFWCSQTFAQWAHQYGQSADSRVSDVVPLKGGLTHALKQKLQKPMIAAKKTNDSSNYQTNGWYDWANWALGPHTLWAPPGACLGPSWALPGLSCASLRPSWALPGPRGLQKPIQLLIVLRF